MDRITREQFLNVYLHVLDDIAVVEAEAHSRVRVYPREANVVIRLIPTAVIDTFGNWIECIPADTIPFGFHVEGVLVEDMQAADTYFVQFATGPTPANADYVGEARLALGGLAGFFPSVPIPIDGKGVDANSSIYGRVKTAGGAGNWVDVSLSLTRHVPVSQEWVHWQTWPW